MPYHNMPQSMWGKMDKCVTDVQGKGHDKKAAIAICYSSLMKGKELDAAIKEFVIASKASDSPGDYLVVEDSKMPTTWHLQVKTNGKPDHRLMGAAWAALHGGYRGNKYEGPNKGAAISKLRKLYEDEGMSVPSEKEIHYRVCAKAITDAPNLRADDFQECGNCKFFQVVAGTETNMMVSPVDTESNGICTQFEFETDADWVCDAWAEIPPLEPMTAKESDLTIVKQKDGSYRWFLLSSSAYQDNDGEIVSQKAQEDDTARMQAANDYGVLNWWHWYRLNGEWKKSKELSVAELLEAAPLRLGVCDFSAMHGKVRIESGTFDDPLVAEQLATHQKELGASLEFLHSGGEPDNDKVYHSIKTFARAILPKERASNRLTQLVVAKEKDVDILKSLVEKLGGDKAAEAKATEILQAAETADKNAQDAKLKSKETETPKPEETKPEGGDRATSGDESTPTEETKPAFSGDIPVGEFKEMIKAAAVEVLTPAVKEILAKQDATAEAQTVATKEANAAITKQFEQIAAKQAELDKRLAELEGLKPRGYRPTEDPSTKVDAATVKEKTPKGDAQADNSVNAWLERNLTGKAH